MAEWRDELAEMEAGLGQPERLTCPVCRQAQPLTADVCGRCGAELGLVGEVMREALGHRQALYRAILDGDTVTAVTLLEAVARLTGPSVELAVLRRLLRFSAVPVEVLGDLVLAEPEAAVEPLAVYGPHLAAPLDPAEAAERAALLALWRQPEPEPQPVPAPPPATVAPEPEPQPAPPPAPPWRRLNLNWVWPLLAIASLLFLGYAAGWRARGDLAGSQASTVEWRMAPPPSSAAPTQP
jgi:hypothetical protein